MTDRAIDAFFSLLRVGVMGAQFNPADYDTLTGDDLSEIYECAKKHDIAQIIGDVIAGDGITVDAELTGRFQKQTMQALYRYTQQRGSLNILREAMNRAKLPFIALKGAVIRDLYPRPWMRTSSDIDLLVRNEDFDRAVKYCGETLGYERGEVTSHDTSFFMKNKVHLELHHGLTEAGRIEQSKVLLDGIWEYAVPVADSYEYILSDEMFYYYHIAHMAKHFEVGGGCGVRSFIDLWLLNHKLPENSRRRDLLVKGGLERFAETAVQVSEYWFSGAEPTESARQMADFVLKAGVYGSEESSMLIRRADYGSQANTLRNKIWSPYKFLISSYPQLEGRRYLQPYYEVRRWLKLLNPETRKKSMRLIRAGRNASTDAVEATGQMLRDLGLR